MPVRGRLHRGLGRRGLVALLAVAGVLGAPGVAQAAVTFDRAFGINVDPSDGNTGDFENCTSTCQTGTLSSAAGGMNQSAGVVLDAQAASSSLPRTSAGSIASKSPATARSASTAPSG